MFSNLHIAPLSSIVPISLSAWNKYQGFFFLKKKIPKYKKEKRYSDNPCIYPLRTSKQQYDDTAIE